MDGNSPIQHSVASSKVKHRFYQWATKWCYGAIEQGIEKPDVPGVVCLLQALGCQLREYEKNEGQGEELKGNSMRIVLECGSSRMRAVLELDDVSCQCSRPEDAKEGSYWSVCGTAPTGSCDSINKFEETGSDLLPPVSKDDRAMIRDVLHRLLETINSKRDINHNRDSAMTFNTARDFEDVASPGDKSESFTRSFTQPEFYRVKDGSKDDFTPPQIVPGDRRISMSAQNIRNIPQMIKTSPTPNRSPKPVLHRQRTWDLDPKGDGEPRPSPPKISSSPVVLGDLCSSLGQVSLQSEDENLSLAECLRRAKYYVEKAQNSYGNVSPGPHNDHKIFVKPLPVRPKTSPGPLKSRPPSALSSPSNLSIQKPIARRSFGVPLPSKMPPIIKTTPTKLTPRRKSIGGSSLQPSLKLAVATAQRNASILKKPGAKSSPSTTSNSSLSSTDSKTLFSAKKRISPDPKGQSPKPGIPQLKSLPPKPVTGINRSHTAIPLGSSGSRGSIPRAKTGSDSTSPWNISLNSSGRKSGIGVPKFSLPKKEK